MADMLTIKENFGQLKGLRLAYIGDGNNVATSLLYAAAHFGMDFSIAAPDGYELPQHVVDTASRLAEKSGSQIELYKLPDDAAAGADVIYTDTWVSMGQESETQQRLATFADYQVNEALLAGASKDCIVLHCLPAHRGHEITDAVADGPQSRIFQQAENRLHAQKAILVHLMS
jgi:ornithine carbamoyltransferase